MKNQIALLLGSIIMLGCDYQEPKLPIPPGEYSGIFYLQEANGSLQSNPVIVTFSGDNYVGSVGSDRIPAGGSGNYLISNDSITFSDINIWTADFDWNLILNGSYSFQKTNSKIILLKGTKGSNIYRYELDII